MPGAAASLARQLARNTEAVCRHYLPGGRPEGRYWLAGDVTGSPGRSLFVRLTGGSDGEGAAGKWSDAATGEHGDLLDLIAANRRCPDLRTTLTEARSFLSLPQPPPLRGGHHRPAPRGSVEAARRLWAMARPVPHTLAARYLEKRGITDISDAPALRYLERCWYRPDRDDAPDTPEEWPALIAAVRSVDGELSGVQRTWLDPSGDGKAPIATPRRAIGRLLGNGVWFGRPRTALAVGEGIETILSLRQPWPSMPMVAGLSANHLAALTLPPALERLYVAQDNDAAGGAALATLTARARGIGATVIPLRPVRGDFNDDLRSFGRNELVAYLCAQIAAEDRKLIVPA